MTARVSEFLVVGMPLSTEQCADIDTACAALKVDPRVFATAIKHMVDSGTSGAQGADAVALCRRFAALANAQVLFAECVTEWRKRTKQPDIETADMSRSVAAARLSLNTADGFALLLEEFQAPMPRVATPDLIDTLTRVM